MLKIGIYNTAFARFDMGATAIDKLKKMLDALKLYVLLF